jgi:outer membrane protein OmpA-like peptidoglycan-associated protein
MSLLSDLLSTFDRHSESEIASTLGESGQSVSRGVQSAAAAVLGGMASRSENPNMLRQILDLVPSGTGGTSWSNIISAASDPNSSLLSAGKRIVSTLFGDSEGSMTRALATESSIPSGKMTSLLAMVAPMVMSFLSRRVRDEGMSMSGLRNLLQREAPTFRSVLPAGAAELLGPHERVTPVVAQTVAAAPSRSWLLPLLLLAAIPLLVWLVSRGNRPIIQTPAASVGTANRAVPDIGELPKPILPSNVDLYFVPGSKNLRPESEAKLKEFAAALAANSNLHATVSGYTDNVGNPETNVRLSQQRADAVKSELVQMGIAADRLTAQGFGEENPIADNSTAEGRDANRRVSLTATDH